MNSVKKQQKETKPMAEKVVWIQPAENVYIHCAVGVIFVVKNYLFNKTKMRKLLFLTVLFFPAIIFSQEFKPLLNPTIACSYGSPDNPIDWETNKTKLVHYFFIVEEMPKPQIPVNEIENLLQNNVHFTAKELAEKGKIAIQCLVNCEGKAGDFQIMYCTTEMANISSQILDVFKKNVTDWKAGIQRGKKVDVLVKIEINVDKGRIEVIRT